MHCLRPIFVFGLLLGVLVPCGAATAEGAEDEAVAVGGHYIADLVHLEDGAANGRTFMVHEAEAAVDLDMAQLAGARGLSAGFHLLATAGDRPNDVAGTLQGINNVEVERHRLRLYQVWLDQEFAAGRASIRLGLVDLNAEFYQNDSAGLLLGPAFGMGSELAATGPNGPSTFPSTALTARLAVQIGRHAYGKFAVINAKSGVLGDPGGVDFSMRDGALLIGEIGTSARGKLAVGVWGYTKRQDDVYDTSIGAAPRKRTAAGAYMLADYRLTGTEQRGLHAFFRAGRSEGATTPFQGGFQAGLLFVGPLLDRPDGKLALGVQQGQLSRGFRRALLEGQSLQPAPSEWGLELTYSDKLAPFFSVQPDVQFIRRSYAENGARSAFVLSLRTTILFAGS